MNARVRVKICGLTTEVDARAAIECGADALGFNLFPGSPRCVDLAQAAPWIRALPPYVTRVAVLVNESLETARRVAADPAIDLVQFHGDEDEAYCVEFAASGHPFVKALRVRDAGSLAGADRFATRDLLLDAHSGGAYGGTGLRIDAGLVGEARARFPELRFILAGGLRPENVAEAVRVARPYAVDVASGVELRPGEKDVDKMRVFMAAVAAAGR